MTRVQTHILFVAALPSSHDTITHTKQPLALTSAFHKTLVTTDRTTRFHNPGTHNLKIHTRKRQIIQLLNNNERQSHAISPAEHTFPIHEGALQLYATNKNTPTFSFQQKRRFYLFLHHHHLIFYYHSEYLKLSQLAIFPVAFSGFTYAVWAIVIFYQYSLRNPDYGRKSD